MKLKEYINETQLDEVVKFVSGYFDGASPEDIRNIVWTHWFYGTLDVVYKQGFVVAVVRWNVDEYVLDVLDLVVKHGENGFRIMKHLVARNWSKFPSAKYIRFKRDRKYPERKSRIYPIKKLLQIGRW